MNIAIIGSGYVGLVTGTCFADLGNNVVCIDNDINKIQKLKNGIIPIYEPGLDNLIKVNRREGRLEFSEDISYGVKKSEIIFICVGTPPKEDGGADLTAIENVAKEIGANLDDYKLIVEKSTVPVRTGEWLRETIEKFNINKTPFDVASNPEFLKEGTAINDFMNPDRVVIGVNEDKAAQILVKLYEPLNAPILVTDINSAEIIKHASNAFLSMKISFINAIANICDLSGADVKRVAKGIGLDARIGEAFLNAGIGFGGFCFPKDLDAFIAIAKKLGYDFNLLKEVRNINNTQKLIPVRKLESVFENLENKQIGFLGLAFKPNTDDMRLAPSIDIINSLTEKGASVKAYDPVATDNAKKVLPGNVQFCSDPYEVAKDSDALIFATEWNEFRFLDFLKIKELMRDNVIIDGRNLFEPNKIKKLGFKYFGIGRG
jgi:UDPglucose 6-dehydrogenase